MAEHVVATTKIRFAYEIFMEELIRTLIAFG
jgi:hypothetical protein